MATRSSRRWKREPAERSGWARGRYTKRIQRLEDGGLIEEAERPSTERSINGQEAQRRYLPPDRARLDGDSG